MTYISIGEYSPICREKENLAYKVSGGNAGGGVVFKHLFIYYFENGRLNQSMSTDAVFVGPCHHGMARPQVADGGTAYNVEDSCE